MDDLAVWLLEQVDEDERIATNDDRVQAAEWTALATGPESDWSAPWEVLRVGGVAFTAIDHEARHAANWDPKRVLAECDAKRRLIADLLAQKHFLDDREWYGCRSVTENINNPDGPVSPTGQPCTCGRDADVERRLRLLTPPFVDRPGYRAEWKP